MTTTLAERQIFSVSDITRNVRFLLEENFSNVWVEGEISNFKLHTSGHLYFSMKDDAAQIQCVMFRRENQSIGFEIGEGMKVVCLGRVSVYAVRGQYQLYVEKIEPKGVGALQLRFEQLKEKLRLEGLFDAARKKEIPYLPRTIAVVTSIDGAALRDILHVLDRRFSNAHVLIYPVPVQGAGAAEKIAEAIDDLDRLHAAEVIVLARGGGSLEDLWAFNEEATARAIGRCRIPVISAVGHETDFTIADFVADLRAATPSAAAEIVLPLKGDLLARLADLKGGLSQAVRVIFKDRRQALKVLEQSQGLKNPLAVFERMFQRLDELGKNLSGRFETLVLIQKEKLGAWVGKLEALGPLETLKRGFSVSLKLPGETVVRSAGFLKAGDHVKTKLADGFFISQVTETHR